MQVLSRGQPVTGAGDRPAVTDADLLLGKLDPAAFLQGGTIPLYPDRSEQALTHHIAEHLDMDALRPPGGWPEMVDENMANAARVHAVENGEDLADYTMIAFGGSPASCGPPVREAGG